MRIIKEYDERRNEILDTAERLFTTKGYEKCTVNDILREVNIAKGTLYHYFKSKEEILDNIVSRYKDIVVTRAEEVINNNNLSLKEKLMHLFLSMNVNDKVDTQILDELHKTENSLLHQKTLNQIVTAMAPILVKVIEEGMDQKIWSCKYPLEYMQIFLVSALSLTDDGIFQLETGSKAKVMAALISMLEKMLNVQQDIFMQMFMQYMEGKE
jgi:AcrR family transcriptional regulator